MAYAPLREADVLWSNLTWSVIDLREKMNHPMYFPTETKGNWKSLMQAILDATTDTSEANPSPLRVYDDEYATIPYTIEGMKEITGTSTTIDLIDDYGDPTGEQQTIFVAWGAKEIFQYVIKDQYFVDKQRSIMEPRLIVVCPMFWYIPLNTNYQTSSYDDDGDMPGVSGRKWRKFGWLYFPEMRPMLATTETFNPQNNAQRRNYDDIFMQRHFSSFIKAEENVHDNREINMYTVNGMDQRLEAEKMKERIRKREHEMWEY
jgi:gliding motility associated protien GldN